MKQDEIIEMAKEAGIRFRRNVFHSGYCDGVHGDELEAFAKLVAAKERERLTDAAMKAAEKAVDVAIALEREACAKVCESLFDLEDDTCNEAEQCAAAIRARGEA